MIDRHANHKSYGAGRVHRFVIIAAPRTGSNLLCSLLNSHPAIVCHHELFNPDRIHYCLDCPQDVDFGSIEERDREPLKFLERVWRCALNKSALGFKLSRGQNELVLQTVMADRDVKKIVLGRSNRVKTCVSEKVARESGRWESYGASESCSNRIKVKLEVDELLRHIDLNSDYYEFVRRRLCDLHQPYLDTAYERLTSKDEWVRILKFLEVEPHEMDLVPRTRKQTPRDLREVVVNFNEVARAVKGSPLDRELHSVDCD
ncbi:MAG TPA: hypothetical protein VLZ81_07945 [Blastocatellia bacterium]|nr:hypothetical protein [Blastocatellia bacterium]